MARPIKVNVPRYLIDLNNPEHWLYTASPPISRADGRPSEEMAVFIRPDDSGQKLFAMTDSIMYKSDPATFVMRPHEHHIGYETWFLDSGSADLYVNGQVTRLEPGSLYHMQPYMLHSMFMHEDVKFRGFFQHWSGTDNVPITQLMEHYQPGLKAKYWEAGLQGLVSDHYIHESFDCVRVSNEEMSALRHPDRPLAKFELDGVTVKLMVGRWECAGVREINYFEFKEGFKAETVEFPLYRELYYVREGKIKFKIFSDEFIAYKDCLVDIPKYIAHSIEALTDSAMYDMGGMTCWYNFLYDYTTILKKYPERANDPAEIETVKKTNGCQIKSFGL